MDVAEVRKKLRAALEHEPRVNLHRDRVEIDYGDGVLTLSGEVADIAAKKLALEQAAALPGVAGVVDRLRVRPADHMGDGAIAADIERALVEDSAFGGILVGTRVRGRPEGRDRGREAPSGAGGNEAAPERSGAAESSSSAPWIEIAVEDGVVTLDGDVPSLSHKRLAGALAWWSPGSRDVINGLGVVPDDQDTDAEILDALRIVLDKDPFIDASQVRAHCTNAVITLEGLAQTETQRDLVEFDAWALFGVDKVINRIAVA